MKNIKSLTLSLTLGLTTLTSLANAEFYYGASFNVEQTKYKKNNTPASPSQKYAFETYISDTFPLQNFILSSTKEEILGNKDITNIKDDTKPELTDIREPAWAFREGMLSFILKKGYTGTINVENADTSQEKYTDKRMSYQYWKHFTNKLFGLEAALAQVSGMGPNLVRQNRIVKFGDSYYINFGKEEKGGITQAQIDKAHQDIAKGVVGEIWYPNETGTMISGFLYNKDGTFYIQKQKGGINPVVDSEGKPDLVKGKDGKLLVIGEYSNIVNNSVSITELQDDFARIEHANIADSASKRNLGASLLVGYIYKMPKVSFDVELSLDLGRANVGDNSNFELEVTRNYGLNLLTRAGYSFIKNSRVYANLGLGFANYKAKYIGLSVHDINESQFTPSAIFGLGFEVAVNNKVLMFYEANFAKSLNSIKTSAGNVKVNSSTLKVGFRYTFN